MALSFEAVGIAEPSHLATLGMLTRAERVPADLVARVVEHVAQIDSTQGGILVFTSGVAEIDQLVRAIKQLPIASQLAVFSLHANQTSAIQKAVFASSTKRKVIVATNVAETSITIDGCVCVIDTGKVKEMGFDNGMSRLQERWVSKASAKQRRGRAGRTRKGLCFKLFSRWTEDGLQHHTTPEILRTPLENLVLTIKATRSDIEPEAYLAQAVSCPSQSNLRDAVSVCERLSALQGGAITPLGRLMSLLPLDMRLAKVISPAFCASHGLNMVQLLVLSIVFRCSSKGLLLAALLSAKPLFLAPREELQTAQEYVVDQLSLQLSNNAQSQAALPDRRE